MDFKKIRPQKGSDMVTNQIREQIAGGQLKPGDRLSSVVDLAAAFGVGRSTVREALSALKAMGWLDIQHGGGTYVKQKLPDPAESGFHGLFHQAESLREILDVRKVLETGCASLAAIHRSPEDLLQLAGFLDQMEQFLSDEEKGEQADVQFHLQIAVATHNSLLVQMMESLSRRIGETMKDSRKLWFYGEQATARRLLQEHRGIFDAIQKQDESLASARMLQHIVKVEKVLAGGGKRPE